MSASRKKRRDAVRKPRLHARRTSIVPFDASNFWTPWLIALTAIGTILRLRYLNQPMRYDEAVTYIYFAGKPWLTAIGSYKYPNNHVFHTALVKLCVTLFGNAPWVIRLPAFFAGVALVPFTFAVGRRTVGPAAAYVGTAFVASSGALTLYSTNGRGYSMVCLATMALCYFLLRVREQPLFSAWVGVVAAASLGFWTIPIMLYPAGGLAIWFAISALRGHTSDGMADLRRLGVALLATACVTVLLYSPILANGGLAPLTENKFVTASSWPNFFGELVASLQPLFELWALGVPALIALAIALLTLIGLPASRARLRDHLPIVWVMLTWCAVTLLATHRTPFVRVWLFLFAPAALIAARGLVRIISRVPIARDAAASSYGIAALVTALGLSAITVESQDVITSLDTGTLSDAPAITQFLTPVLRSGDYVMAPLPSNAPMQYAFLRAGLDTAAFSRKAALPNNVYLIINKGEGASIATPIADRLIATFPNTDLIARFPLAELYRLSRKEP